MPAAALRTLRLTSHHSRRLGSPVASPRSRSTISATQPHASASRGADRREITATPAMLPFSSSRHAVPPLPSSSADCTQQTPPSGCCASGRSRLPSDFLLLCSPIPLLAIVDDRFCRDHWKVPRSTCRLAIRLHRRAVAIGMKQKDHPPGAWHSCSERLLYVGNLPR